MEEIKVDDFCRNKEGKIIEVGWVGNAVVTDIYDNITFSKLSGEIVKHSSDIKEIVQAGDIILYNVNSKMTDIEIVKEHIDARTQKRTLRVGMWSLEQVEIKEILTKEQFNQMKYIVGDE